MLIPGVLAGLQPDKDRVIHVGQLRAVLVYGGQVLKLAGGSLQLQFQAPGDEELPDEPLNRQKTQGGRRLDLDEVFGCILDGRRLGLRGVLCCREEVQHDKAISGKVQDLPAKLELGQDCPQVILMSQKFLKRP